MDNFLFGYHLLAISVYYYSFPKHLVGVFITVCI